MSRLRKVFRGRDLEFLELFEQAAANVVAGAETLERMIADWPDTAALGSVIKDLEHEGDRITQSISQRVNRTASTIARGDVVDLAHALDDVVDLAEEAADLLGLYRIEAPTEQAVHLSSILHLATREVAAAITQLRTTGDVTETVAAVHRLEKEGDVVSREAIAALFETGIDPMTVIRWKDVYERLEDAIDATERVADLLDGIVVKIA